MRGRRPITPKTTAKIMPMMAQIQARFTAVPAIPLKPRTAAISAMTKNVTAQEIMCSSFLIEDWREQKCFRPRHDVRGAFQGDRTTTSEKVTVKILSCMFAGTQYLSRPDETRTPFFALTLVPRPLFSTFPRRQRSRAYTLRPCCRQAWRPDRKAVLRSLAATVDVFGRLSAIA